jgi:hypothetical protein
MSTTPTPGQIAYEGFMRATLASLAEQEAIMPWESPLFLASERDAWEAAAQAVLDHADFPPFDLGVREEDTS